LSINEALALCSLEETRVSSGELAHELGLSPGRMSRILGVLENEGFVCRTISEDDKRVMFFEITPLGREKLAHMHANRVCAPNFEGI
jgi:DNA-binding MarR family transcriptional regulator